MPPIRSVRHRTQPRTGSRRGFTCGCSQGTPTTMCAPVVVVSIPDVAMRAAAIAGSTHTIAPSGSLCSRLPSPRSAGCRTRASEFGRLAVCSQEDGIAPGSEGSLWWTASRVFGPSIRPWTAGARVSRPDRPARLPPLAINQAALAFRVAGNERIVQVGAMEGRESWKAGREALAELRSERIAERAALLSRCAVTRRRAQELRLAAEAVRGASREECARSLSAQIGESGRRSTGSPLSIGLGEESGPM